MSLTAHRTSSGRGATVTLPGADAATGVMCALLAGCLAMGASAGERAAPGAAAMPRRPTAHAAASARMIAQGRGEAVFIFPARGEPLESWRPQLVEFAGQFEATVVEWTAADLADPQALAARLQSRTNEPAHLIGEGEGARLALRLALEYPDRVRSIVLSAPDPHWFARDAAVEAARAGASLPAGIDTLLSGCRLGRITVPVLMLGGDRDPRRTGDHSSSAWIRTAREQTIRGAGSRPHVHASIEFNRAIARFLERQRMTAGAP